MAYDEFIADRIRQVFNEKHVQFSEMKMMGGLLYKVNEKMLCGIHIDKKFGDTLLMARIGELAYQEQISNKHCLPMDFTGRPMKGYIFVTPNGFDTEKELNHWIDLCLLHNPEAKASVRKKKRK